MSGEAILRAKISEKSLGGQGSALNPTGELTVLRRPVMWSETVGIRTRSETQKIGVGLASFVLCCFVKYNLVTLVVIMILEDTAAFQVLV